jgi:hypothetical protein
VRACGSTSRRARIPARVSRSRRAAPGPGDRYRLDRGSALRTPARGRRTASSTADGIVAAPSGRRYALWISGIESRARCVNGTPCDGFAGRRHFDDAFLVERYFARAAGDPGTRNPDRAAVSREPPKPAVAKNVVRSIRRARSRVPPAGAAVLPTRAIAATDTGVHTRPIRRPASVGDRAGHVDHVRRRRLTRARRCCR